MRRGVRAPGARFASVRFVTGRLDPLDSRDELLALAGRTSVPTLLLYGAETPLRSRAEMEALAAVSGIRSIVLPRGKLSVLKDVTTGSHPDKGVTVGPNPAARAAADTAVRAFLRERLQGSSK